MRCPVDNSRHLLRLEYEFAVPRIDVDTKLKSLMQIWTKVQINCADESGGPTCLLQTLMQGVHLGAAYQISGAAAQLW